MRSSVRDHFKAIERPSERAGREVRINLLPTTCHIYFGAVTGATPDGRKAGTPVSEGISPVQGADRRGPTAVLMSAAKMDHVRTGGTLLNQKFTPKLLEGERGIDRLWRSSAPISAWGDTTFNSTSWTPRRSATRRRIPRAQGPHRPRGGVQRLFLRPRPGAAGRDHRAHRTPGVLVPETHCPASSLTKQERGSKTSMCIPILLSSKKEDWGSKPRRGMSWLIHICIHPTSILSVPPLHPPLSLYERGDLVVVQETTYAHPGKNRPGKIHPEGIDIDCWLTFVRESSLTAIPRSRSSSKLPSPGTRLSSSPHRAEPMRSWDCTTRRALKT